jgi:hypothetical protein
VEAVTIATFPDNFDIAAIEVDNVLLVKGARCVTVFLSNMIPTK